MLEETEESGVEIGSTFIMMWSMADLEKDDKPNEQNEGGTIKVTNKLSESILDLIRNRQDLRAKIATGKSLVEVFEEELYADSLLSNTASIDVKKVLGELSKLRNKKIIDLNREDLDSLEIDSERAQNYLEVHKKNLGSATVKSAVVSATFGRLDKDTKELFDDSNFAKACTDNGFSGFPVPTDVVALREYFVTHSSRSPYDLIVFITGRLNHSLQKKYRNNPETLERKVSKISALGKTPWRNIDTQLQSLGLKLNSFEKEQLDKGILYTGKNSKVQLKDGLKKINNDVSVLFAIGIEGAKADAMGMLERLNTAPREVLSAQSITRPQHLKITRSEFYLMNKDKRRDEDISEEYINEKYQDHIKNNYGKSWRGGMTPQEYQTHKNFAIVQENGDTNDNLKSYIAQLITKSTQTLRDFADEYAMPKDSIALLEKFFDPEQKEITLPGNGKLTFKKKEILLVDPTHAETNSELRRPLIEIDIEHSQIPPYLRSFLNLPAVDNPLKLKKNYEQGYLTKEVGGNEQRYGERNNTVGWFGSKQGLNPIHVAEGNHDNAGKLEPGVSICEMIETEYGLEDRELFTFSNRELKNKSIGFEAVEQSYVETLGIEELTKKKYVGGREVSFFEAIEAYRLTESTSTYDTELADNRTRLEELERYKKLPEVDKQKRQNDIQEFLKKKRGIESAYEKVSAFGDNETPEQKYERLGKTKFVNLKNTPNELPSGLNDFHKTEAPIAGWIQSNGQIVANSQYWEGELAKSTTGQIDWAGGNVIFDTSSIDDSLLNEAQSFLSKKTGVVQDEATGERRSKKLYPNFPKVSILAARKILARHESEMKELGLQVVVDVLKKQSESVNKIFEKFEARKSHESMHRLIMMQKNIGILGESYSGTFEGYKLQYDGTLSHEEIIALDIKLEGGKTFNPTHELLCKIAESRNPITFGEISDDEKKNALNVCDARVVLEANLKKNGEVKLQRVVENKVYDETDEKSDKYIGGETIQFSTNTLNKSLHTFLGGGLLTLKDGVKGIQSFGAVNDTSNDTGSDRTGDELDKNSFDIRYVRQYSLRQAMNSDQVELADAANTQAIDENSTVDEIGTAYLTYAGANRDPSDPSSPNRQNYASTIAEYVSAGNKELFEQTARDIRTQMENEAQALGFQLTEYGQQDTWAYWHIAKSKYVSDNRDTLRQNPTYTKYAPYIGDPLDPQNQNVREFIKNVHLGFEATAQEDITQLPEAIQDAILELQERGYDDTSSLEFAELGAALGGIAQTQQPNTNTNQNSTQPTATNQENTNGNSVNQNQNAENDDLPKTSEQLNAEQKKAFKDAFDDVFMGDETVDINDNPVIVARAQGSKLQGGGSLRYTGRIETNEGADSFRVIFDSTTEVDKSTESKVFPKTVESIKSLQNSLKELYAFKQGGAYADLRDNAFTTKKGSDKISKAFDSFGGLTKSGTGYLKNYVADDGKTASQEPVTHRGSLRKRKGGDNVLFEVTPEGNNVRVIAKSTGNENHFGMDHVMDTNAFLLFIADKGLQPYCDAELEREEAKDPSRGSDENQAGVQGGKRSDSFVSISAMLAGLKKIPEKFKYRFEQEEKYQASLFIKQYASIIPDSMTFLYANEIKNDLMTEHDDTIWSVINSYKDQISQKDGAGGTHAKVIAGIIETEVFNNPTNAIRARHKAAGYLLYAAEKGNMYIRNLSKYADQGKRTEVILGKEKAAQMRAARAELYARMKTSGATDDEYDNLVKYEMRFIFKHTTDHPYFGPKFGRALEDLHDKYSGSGEIDNVKNDQLAKGRFDVIYSETFSGGGIGGMNPKVAMGALLAMEEKVEDRTQYTIFYQCVLQLLLSGFVSYEFDNNMKDKFKGLCRRKGIPIGMLCKQIDHPQKTTRILNYITSNADPSNGINMPGSLQASINELGINNFTSLGNEKPKYQEISKGVAKRFSNSQVSNAIIDAFNYKNTHLLQGLTEGNEDIIEYFGPAAVSNDYIDYGSGDAATGQSPFYEGILNLGPGTFKKQIIDQVGRVGSGTELLREFDKSLDSFRNLIETTDNNEGKRWYTNFLRKKLELYFGSQIGDDNLNIMKEALFTGGSLSERKKLFERVAYSSRLLGVAYKKDGELLRGKDVVNGREDTKSINDPTYINTVENFIELLWSSISPLDDTTKRNVVGGYESSL